MVEALQKMLPPGSEIDLITTLPNRYKSFSTEAAESEVDGIVNIRRIRLPSHRSGMADQARAFSVYAARVLGLTRRKRYDLVYATSSRMFTAFLGALCAKRFGAPLYLDIRDIFNDTIGDVLRGKAVKALMPLLEWVERFTINAASRVNVVSEGFLPYFESRYPGQSFSFFPNGIDDEFLDADFSPSVTRPEGRYRVLYAGNIGQGQGLHRIVPGLAESMEKAGFTFEIVGDGGARTELEKALAERNISNVELHAPVSRSELLERYRKADVLFLHLNDLAAFKKVLPSKLFEYAATGKPILAGVAGYAGKFLSDHVENAAVFSPCDVKEGEAALRSLRMTMTDRSDFISRFRRDHLARKLAADALEVARSTTSMR